MTAQLDLFQSAPVPGTDPVSPRPDDPPGAHTLRLHLAAGGEVLPSLEASREHVRRERRSSPGAAWVIWHRNRAGGRVVQVHYQHYRGERIVQDVPADVIDPAVLDAATAVTW